MGIVAGISGGEEVDKIVKGFAKVAQKIIFINRKGRGNCKGWSGGKGKSRVDGCIVIGEWGTTGWGG